MDNRINEIRRKMSVLRADMVRVEDTMHEQIKHDLDSTEAALRLMAMRAELGALVAEWKASLAAASICQPSKNASKQTTARLGSRRPLTADL